MFNSYVKLPEGNDYFQIQWFISFCLCTNFAGPDIETDPIWGLFFSNATHSCLIRCIELGPIFDGETKKKTCFL